MARAGSIPSFDEMIQADRHRRKNEQLANEIFGKSRRPGGPGSLAKKNYPALTLASRISKAKRSSSASTMPPRANLFNSPQPPPRPSSTLAQYTRANKLASAVNNDDQSRIIPTPQPRQDPAGPGFSIKGTAGPFVVQASNFAPGTTAADIEAAIQSVAWDSNGNSSLLKCRVLTSSPTVIAEMAFSERYIADNVVKTFNNEKADGRILHLFLKEGSPSPASFRAKNELLSALPDAQTAAPPPNPSAASISQAEDIEMTMDESYDDTREVADRDRQDREGRRADLAIQDNGSGFRSRGDLDRRNENRRDIVFPRGGSAARINDPSGTQSRDQGRDKRFDSRHSNRRDERGSYARDSHYRDYQRDQRPQSHSNGVSGRDYRGSSGYGRMYSDDMMRGPPRAGRVDGLRGGSYR